MTGAQHYDAAQDLLDSVGSGRLDDDQRRNVLLKAQVHATLALTQATLVIYERADWE